MSTVQDRMFQSAPPHGGRRAAGVVVAPLPQFQSAPPHGGRLGVRLDQRPRQRVSIRAPAWGATELAAGAHPGADVSIRAPAWGATIARRRGPAPRRCFNPRPRMGGDAVFEAGWVNAKRFQSAPPHGGRLRDRIHLLKNVKFANVREVVFKTPEIPGGRHSLLGNLAKSH